MGVSIFPSSADVARAETLCMTLIYARMITGKPLGSGFTWMWQKSRDTTRVRPWFVPDVFENHSAEANAKLFSRLLDQVCMIGDVYKGWFIYFLSRESPLKSSGLNPSFYLLLLVALLWVCLARERYLDELLCKEQFVQMVVGNQKERQKQHLSARELWKQTGYLLTLDLTLTTWFWMLQRPLLVMPYTGLLSLMGTCAFCLFFRGVKMMTTR